MTKQLFYEGARFPSPNLAPISTPYIIHWVGDGYYSVSIMQPHETVTDRRDWADTYYYSWVDAGVLPLARTYVIDPNNPGGGYLTEDKLYEQYKVPADNGYYGMNIDEYKYQAQAIKNSVNAIRRLKQDYPDFFVMVWYFSSGGHMGIHEEAVAGKDIINIYSPEVFHQVGEDPGYTFDEIEFEINSVKSYNLEGKTIFTLATAWVEGHAPPSLIDAQLKHIRNISSIVASNGICLYRLAPWSDSKRAEYDAVVDENFFKPSPTAEITSLHNGDTVSGAVTISVIGTPNSGTGSPIVSYRYFIDNECVRISPHSEYLWNTAGYSEGAHVITVHAVAGDYLAGVAQINVIVGEAVTGTISGTVTDKDTGLPISGVKIIANGYEITTE